MKKLLLAAAFAIGFAPAAIAHEYKLGDLTIGHPFVRATPPVTVGGGYLVIENCLGDDARTSGIGDDRSVARQRVARNGHGERRHDDAAGVAGIEVAGGKVELKPGGLHVMLIGLVKPLVKGETIKATLVFEKAGSVDVVFNVEAIGAGAPSSTSSGAHAH